MVITDKPVLVRIQWVKYAVLGIICALLSWCALVDQLRPLGPVLLCAAVMDKRYFATAFSGALIGTSLAGFNLAALALNCLPVIFNALMILIVRYLGRKKYLYK